MADAALQQWLAAVHQHQAASTLDDLFLYFRGAAHQPDLTPSILNMVNAAVKKVFPAAAAATAAAGAAEAAEVGDDAAAGSDGARACSSGAPARPCQQQQCAVYLYYTVAKHVLHKLYPPGDAAAASSGQAGRFKGLLQVPLSPGCYALVSEEEFHMPLLECAAMITAAVTGADNHDDSSSSSMSVPSWVTALLGRRQHGAALWQAARDFQECFSADSVFPLPLQLQMMLQHWQCCVLDAPLLMQGSLLFSMAVEGAAGCPMFANGSRWLVPASLKAFAEQAVCRAQAVAWQLQQNQDPQQPLSPDYHERCAWLMDQVLLHHLPLCFGQQLSTVVACVVYMCAKLLQAPLTFDTITKVVPQGATAAGAAPQASIVRSYYNSRFLPSLEVCVWQYMEQYAHRNVLAGQPCAAPPAHLSPGAAQGMRGVAGAGSVSRTPLASLPLLNNVSHAASGAAGGCKQGASAHLPGSARSGQHAAAGCGFAVCGVTTSSSGWTPVRHMR